MIARGASPCLIRQTKGRPWLLAAAPPGLTAGEIVPHVLRPKLPSRQFYFRPIRGRAEL